MFSAIHISDKIRAQTKVCNVAQEDIRSLRLVTSILWHSESCLEYLCVLDIISRRISTSLSAFRQM